MSPGATSVSTKEPFGLTGAVIVVPTTSTVSEFALRAARLAPLEARPATAEPLMKPLMVAPPPRLLCELNSLGDEGDDPQATAPDATTTHMNIAAKFL